MEASYFIAAVLGLYLTVIALAILSCRRAFLRTLDDFLHNPACVMFSGVINLLFGLMIVVAHNVWTTDWRVLITILGWFMILTGVGRTIFLQQAIAFGMKVKKMRWFRPVSVGVLLIGFFLQSPV